MNKPNIIRGIDHLGITVPSIESATEYFKTAFGAEVLYDVLTDRDVPLGGHEIESAVGIAEGTRVRAIRLLRLHDGPSLELFEYIAAGQRTPAIPSDFGLQHLAIYVDDLAEAASRVRAAGGEVLPGPTDLPAIEGGPGNKFWYTRTPWGMTIEIITYPGSQPYEHRTKMRRWRPPVSRDNWE